MKQLSSPKPTRTPKTAQVMSFALTLMSHPGKGLFWNDAEYQNGKEIIGGMTFCDVEDSVYVDLRNQKVIEQEYKWTLEVLSSKPKEGLQLVWANYDAQTKWWRHTDGSLHLSGNPNLFVGCGPCYDAGQEGEV